MKNIHILSTSQPSRLYINMQGILSKSNSLLLRLKSRNIYITNSEEIKDKCYVLSDSSIGALYLDGVINTASMLAKGQWKKVVLTTDVDLIKNNVQAIDDEFLEWFVKNPSCEEVEVKFETLWLNKRFGGTWQPFPDEQATERKKRYKIIISKEEPKQESIVNEKCFKCNASQYKMRRPFCTDDFCNKDFYQKHKQETLEEAAENYARKQCDDMYDDIAPSGGSWGWETSTDFINGAKWQQEQFKNKSTANYIDRHIVEALVETAKQERMYSEEDMKTAFREGFVKSYDDTSANSIYKREEYLKKWFEQFKNK